MDDQHKDATLEEKIAYLSGSLKPMYKERYESSLLLEALDALLTTYDDSEGDKASKEFQSKRKAEVEKALARNQKMIDFFEAKLKPLAEKQKQIEEAIKLPCFVTGCTNPVTRKVGGNDYCEAHAAEVEAAVKADHNEGTEPAQNGSRVKERKNA